MDLNLSLYLRSILRWIKRKLFLELYNNLYVIEEAGELYAVDKARKLVEGLSYSSNLYDERVKLIKEYVANNQ